MIYLISRWMSKGRADEHSKLDQQLYQDDIWRVVKCVCDLIDEIMAVRLYIFA